MTLNDLVKRVKTICEMKKVPIPRCISTDDFLICYCGRCKQKSYELPDDFRKQVVDTALYLCLKDIYGTGYSLVALFIATWVSP